MSDKILILKSKLAMLKQKNSRDEQPESTHNTVLNISMDNFYFHTKELFNNQLNFKSILCSNFANSKLTLCENTKDTGYKNDYSMINERDSSCVYNSNSCNEKFTIKEYSSNIMNKSLKLEDFELIHKISEGVYGVVYKVKYLQNNKIYALKRIKTQWINDSKNIFPYYFQREFNIIHRLYHPNIVHHYDIFDNIIDNQMYVMIVMEYVGPDTFNSTIPSGIDIKHNMKDERVKHIYGAKRYIKQVLQAVSYLHKRQIVHRDIKPSNILIDSNQNIKLCDFGLSRFITDPNTQLTANVVSIPYRAPELLFNYKKYTNSVDMWSIGCVFYEIMRNKLLFPSNSELECIKLMIDVLGSPRHELFNLYTEGCTKYNDIDYNTKVNPLILTSTKYLEEYTPVLSDQGVDFILSLLHWDYRKRLTADAALNHPFLNEV